MSKVLARVAPAFRARSELAWIDGPSAIGSENGIPNSMMSAPAAARPPRISMEVAGSGSPAVTKATRPPRRCAFSSEKRLSMRLVACIIYIAPLRRRCEVSG